MDEKTIIELTNKLYRLSLLFPKKEPLRYKMRETANEVLARFIDLRSLESANPGEYANSREERKKEAIFEIEKNLSVLNGYFEVAKWQNWASYFDFLDIQEEYAKIRQNLEEEIKNIGGRQEKAGGLEPVAAVLSGPEKPDKDSPKKPDFIPRKEKIINILKRVERIQVGEVNRLFPDVCKRTIRRDFQKLVKQGIIERVGEKTNTFYCLKPSSQKLRILQ